MPPDARRLQNDVEDDLARCTARGDLAGQADALMALGTMAMQAGCSSIAQAWYGRAWALYTQMGDAAGADDACYAVACIVPARDAGIRHFATQVVRSHHDPHPNASPAAVEAGLSHYTGLSRRRTRYLLRIAAYRRCLHPLRDLERWITAANLSKTANHIRIIRQSYQTVLNHYARHGTPQHQPPAYWKWGQMEYDTGHRAMGLALCAWALALARQYDLPQTDAYERHLNTMRGAMPDDPAP